MRSPRPGPAIGVHRGLSPSSRHRAPVESCFARTVPWVSRPRLGRGRVPEHCSVRDVLPIGRRLSAPPVSAIGIGIVLLRGRGAARSSQTSAQSWTERLRVGVDVVTLTGRRRARIHRSFGRAAAHRNTNDAEPGSCFAGTGTETRTGTRRCADPRCISEDEPLAQILDDHVARILQYLGGRLFR